LLLIGHHPIESHWDLIRHEKSISGEANSFRRKTKKIASEFIETHERMHKLISKGLWNGEALKPASQSFHSNKVPLLDIAIIEDLAVGIVVGIDI